MSYRYLAADGVVFVDGSVVLLRRDHPPFEGRWVLPGGMVEQDETAREACVREVGEEVGIDIEARGFVGLYDDPDRDERGNVSAAYVCVPVGNTGEVEPEAGDEARDVGLFGVDSLPELGFDHADIVDDADTRG